MLLFYWAQLSFPLGVLAIAAIVRMLVALALLIVTDMADGGTLRPTQPT